MTMTFRFGEERKNKTWLTFRLEERLQGSIAEFFMIAHTCAVAPKELLLRFGECILARQC
jgi:hypothetical protein